MAKKYYANRDRYKLGFDFHKDYTASPILDERYAFYKFPSKKEAERQARSDSYVRFYNTKFNPPQKGESYYNEIPIISKIRYKLKKR